MGQYLWPYTADYGIPQVNEAPARATMARAERLPGLWQIPLYRSYSQGMELVDGGAEVRVNARDIGEGAAMNPGGDVYLTLRAMLQTAYSGNRSPVPIYVHKQWFTAAHIQELQAFMDDVASMPDVYWVTMSQLVDWLKDPVPLEFISQSLLCPDQGGAAYRAKRDRYVDLPSPPPVPVQPPQPPA
ncbi:hypothetical protein H632_c5223p0, partial [Helicosporidium sp. ATCC 50920]